MQEALSLSLSLSLANSLYVGDLVALPSSGVAPREISLNSASSSCYYQAEEVDMVRKRDRFWEYVELLDGKFKCKFCKRKFAGGVPRIKSHLSGIKGGGIDTCTKVPEDVRIAAAEAIPGLNKRVKAEACSGKTEETLPKMLISKDDVMPDQLLAKFILFDGVDVDIVRRPSFIDFVNAVAKHGSHYKLPSCSVVKTKLVPDLQKEIGQYVANVKKSWVRAGCTLIYDYWEDEDRFFICIFAYSIEGVVLFNALEIPHYHLELPLSNEILYFVTQEIGANNVVQHISGNANYFFNWTTNDDDPYVYKTTCVAYKTQHLFEEIYDSIVWIQNAFDQARAVVTKIQEHDGILSSMKQFTDYVRLQQSSMMEFYSDYYMLQSIMRLETELRSLVSSSKWLSLGFEKDESGIVVGEIIRSSEFWSEGKEVLRALEPIFRVLCLVDGYGANFGFLYAAVEMADEAIRQIYVTNVPKYQTLREIFKRWQDDISHPLHAAAAFLNPAYMCGEKFIQNVAMKEGMDFMLEKLVGVEEKEKFKEEMLRFRDQLPKLFAKAMLGTSHPCDWWDSCGDVLPVLKKYAIRILSQPCSTFFCRQIMSAFETAQTEQWEQFVPAVIDDYLYLRTNALLMQIFNNMKEKIRKPLDLEKLCELPEFTEFLNENFTHGLLNMTKVALLDGKLNCWSASLSKDGESEKHLRLQFITKLPSSLVKGDRIQGWRGTPVHVILVDSSTGRVVQSGPLSMQELMVTVIGGDSDDEAGRNWTKEFFGSNEIKGREGNMPLLNGDLSVTLKKGLGRLGAITFNDVSSWTSSEKFRLGVKTALGCCEGIHVLEGISNAFTVEDGPFPPPQPPLPLLQAAHQPVQGTDQIRDFEEYSGLVQGQTTSCSEQMLYASQLQQSKVPSMSSSSSSSNEWQISMVSP